MTPGTKVRTKVYLAGGAVVLPRDACGVVVATHSELPYSIEVDFEGQTHNLFLSADELETIE